MNLYEKLLEIQKSVEGLVKDGTNQSDKYSYVSSDMALNHIRPKMNELSLLLKPNVTGSRVQAGQTKTGTTRYLTEIDMTFTWIDVESGETDVTAWYAQGVDLAGEKGVGKAQTYAEKYFLMKFFHVPTSKDDPDAQGKNGNGEQRQRGTQAGKETLAYQRRAIEQMVNAITKGDAEKVKATFIAFTKMKDGPYAGVDNLEALNDAQVKVVYGKAKAHYKKRVGKDFEMEDTDE